MATASTTAVAQLNRVQYVGLDFPTHFDDLRSDLQTKFAADFNDFALSSLAIMLIDLTAYGLDTLSFYLDRRASDSYLETAQTRKAVARLTRQLGYKMGGAISSSTDVQVSITTPVNFQVTIPQGFQFRGPNNLVFEAGESTVFPALSSASQLIPVYEGETITETFTGDGTANQVFTLRRVPEGKNVVQNSALVLVNGAPFTEAEFLPIGGGQFFEVGYNDDPPTIRFGDGSVSQSDIPLASSTVSVTYIAATGLAGQVAAGTITSTVANLVVNFQSIPLTITNPEAAVGGDNPESLERAKTLAGEVYKSRRVAVTQSDYIALSGSYADPLYGRVAVAQAYSTRSADADLELQQLLQDVRDTISPVKSAVDAQVTALTTQMTTATTNLTAISDANTAIAAETSSANTALGNATTQLETLNNSLVLTASRAVDGAVVVAGIAAATSVNLITTASYTQPSVAANVTVAVSSVTGLTIGQTVTASVAAVPAGIYTVASVPTALSVELTLTSVPVGGVPVAGTVASGAGITSTPSDALTTATKNSLSGIFAAINSDITSEQTVASTVSTNVGIASDDVTAIGTTTTSGLLNDITVAKAAAQTAVTVASGIIAPALTAAVAPLATTGVATSTVNFYLADINDHVDSLLSANCSANLITVPILTKDADGFYAAPTLGLRQSLQNYLDARKAVTQTVSVTSGERALVRVILTVQVGVQQGYSENVVRLAVQTALDGLLKNRAFGVSLYRSDITETVLAVEGVSYVNPSIDGYLDPDNPSVTLTTKIDSYGNLIIDLSEVVTKFTVTVTTVLAPVVLTS
jgi:hypothetical protein